MEDETTMAVNEKGNKKSTQGEEWHLYEPHLLCIADTCSVLVTRTLNDAVRTFELVAIRNYRNMLVLDEGTANWHSSQ